MKKISAQNNKVFTRSLEDGFAPLVFLQKLFAQPVIVKPSQKTTDLAWRKKTKPSYSAGFTLLFASLVVSLVLVIGLAITNTSLQQFLLSSSGKESQKAFYNADTGIECALYYDHGKVDGFAFPTTPTEQIDAPPIICNGQTSYGTPQASYSFPTTTTTYLINPSTSCTASTTSFTIEVNKSSAGDETYNTVIRSRGYDTCDPTDPRRVERGLEVKY